MTIASWLRRNAVYPLWVAKDKSPRLRYLRELEETQYWDRGKLRELQMHKLRDMIGHAYEHTQYYRALFDDAGVRPGDIRDERDLRRIPILDKHEVRRNQDAFIAQSMRGMPTSIFRTGGSTGVPVEILKDAHEVELLNAAGLRVFRWTGWNIGEPVGMVWGNPHKPANIKERLHDALIGPTIYLDTMSLTNASMTAFVEHWGRVKPTMLRGHSHSIYIFAAFCRKNAITSIRPAGIISSSMMLLPVERRVIEDAFACKVTDLYGCEEVGLIACECERHQGMHIDMENNLVEIVDPHGNNVKPGENGAVVVTSLLNRYMPLVRYRMGDIASFQDRACACGRTLALMDNVAGRVADFLVRKDGSVVAGVSLVERTLTKYPGIAQMQIVQEDIDTIILRIAKDANYTEETERAVVAEFKHSVGEHNDVRIEFVEAIPQEKSGKFRFAVSKVPNPFD